MKLLVGVFLLAAAFNSYASKNECVEKLTSNFSLDSKAFKVDLDSIVLTSHENDLQAQSREIIRFVLNGAGCNGNADINFGWGPDGRTKNNCQNLIKGKDSSAVCYIEADIGYFIITKDLQTTAHIIFSRWD